MRAFGHIGFAGVSLMALSAPAFAQGAPATEEVSSNDDIIVQARRKDESLQEVPLTVNAVSAQTLQKLNIRDLKDITSVVPGLVLNPGNRTTGALSSLRGLNVDVNSSGNNGTVQFYLNDSPISAGVVLQSLFDIGQIEVLRGPQGTLRGLASPSGSITVTSKRPVMGEWGGYVQGTATSIGGVNINGAVNVPLVKDVLAIRVGGLVENNEGNRINSITSPGTDPRSKTSAVRASVRFTPDDNFEINASYFHLVKNFTAFDQVESSTIADAAVVPSAGPARTTLIRARDRLAVENVANVGHQAFDVFNWQAQWSFAGQRLNYVGSYAKQDLRSSEPYDKGDLFGASIPGDGSLSNNNETYFTAAPTLNLQNAAQASHSYVRQESHELRLSSEERLFGMFDYTVGAFVTKQLPWTDLVRYDAAALPGAIYSGVPLLIAGANGQSITGETHRRGRTIERAAFGNLTAHFGENTELSGGVRFINYQENTNNSGQLVTGGPIIAQGPSNTYKHTIWNASLKHKFSDDLMVYATAGSSFRVGSGTNGLILGSTVTSNGSANVPVSQANVRDPNLAAYFPTTPETSKSYEIGFRSTWLEKRLTINVSAFHQDFQGYIIPVQPFYILNNSSGSPVVPNEPLVVTTANPTQVTITRSTLAASVPAKVNGVEAEISFRPSDNFSIGTTIAYAKAKITGGQLPCVFTTQAAAQAYYRTSPANQQVCIQTVNQSAGRLAPFTATVQAEYSHSITESYSGFLRGLAQFYGNSTNDAQNPFDDVRSYALLNLYAGVRSEEGGWEVTAYAKNITNTFRVLSRDSSAQSVRALYAPGTAAINAPTASNYRLISVTEPREFGITAKMSFGSR
jgi:iron complex outermembrane receptor protein